MAVILCGTLCVVLSKGVYAQDSSQATNGRRIFPANAGVVNVKEAPYHAQGDGVTDDTEAIQQALLDHPAGNRIIFLPKGTYLLSAPLRWPGAAQLEDRQRATILMGESRTETVLRLADYAPGFEYSGRSPAMLWMGDSTAYHYRNAVRNLTLVTGIGNPGASGIRFMSNSQGGIFDVDIVSGESGAGFIGLDLNHSDQMGPSLFKNLRIHGFEYGIRSGTSLNALTFENLELTEQGSYGVRNSGQTLVFYNFRSTNAGPAIQNSGGGGMVCLVNAVCHELPAPRRTSALLNRGFMYVQNLVTVGYTNAIQSRGETREDIVGPEVPLFVSHSVAHAFPAPHRSLGLAVEPTPEAPWDPLEQWASPLDFGGVPDDGQNDAEAIQRAIDSGATTVYLPNGTWNLYSPVEIRGRVRRLIGCEARVVTDRLNGPAAIRVGEGSEPVVWVEGLEIVNTLEDFLDQASSRRLVVKSCMNLRMRFSGRGDVFLEDVSSRNRWLIPGNRVWARQWFVDAEGDKVVNEGGTLWALGLTTIRPGTAVRTERGGKTEILGGAFIATGHFKEAPMLEINEGSASFVGSEMPGGGSPYQIPMIETRDGKTVRVSIRDTSGVKLASQIGGVALPLYSGFDGPDAVPLPKAASGTGGDASGK